MAEYINNKIITYSDTHHHINYCQTPCIISGGEQAKNHVKFLEQVLAYINKSLDRHSVIIGIGGGALLDLVGFAAAIGHRGIQHIRIPTTVLAQNDAGVGVMALIFLIKKIFLAPFHHQWL